MSPNREPTSPREAYKAIIDQLVMETSHGVAERLVRESGIFSKTYNQGEANQLVQSLTAEQRRVMGGMLHEERISAIAGALAVLTWWIDCRDVVLTFQGERMPMELTEEGLHGDYLARSNGWEWLDSGGSAGK